MLKFFLKRIKVEYYSESKKFSRCLQKYKIKQLTLIECYYVSATIIASVVFTTLGCYDDKAVIGELGIINSSSKVVRIRNGVGILPGIE